MGVFVEDEDEDGDDAPAREARAREKGEGSGVPFGDAPKPPFGEPIGAASCVLGAAPGHAADNTFRGVVCPQHEAWTGASRRYAA